MLKPVCTKCQKPVPFAASFCPACGCDRREGIRPSAIPCPNHEPIPDVMFCTACGTELPRIEAKGEPSRSVDARLVQRWAWIVSLHHVLWMGLCALTYLQTGLLITMIILGFFSSLFVVNIDAKRLYDISVSPLKFASSPYVMAQIGCHAYLLLTLWIFLTPAYLITRARHYPGTWWPTIVAWLANLACAVGFVKYTQFINAN